VTGPAGHVQLDIPRQYVTAVNTALARETARRIGEAQNTSHTQSIRAIYQAEGHALADMIGQLMAKAKAWDHQTARDLATGADT
jgi:hypothetical protein